MPQLKEKRRAQEMGVPLFGDSKLFNQIWNGLCPRIQGKKSWDWCLEEIHLLQQKRYSTFLLPLQLSLLLLYPFASDLQPIDGLRQGLQHFSGCLSVGGFLRGETCLAFRPYLCSQVSFMGLCFMPMAATCESFGSTGHSMQCFPRGNSGGFVCQE